MYCIKKAQYISVNRPIKYMCIIAIGIYIIMAFVILTIKKTEQIFRYICLPFCNLLIPN